MKRKHLSPTRLLALGFAVVILGGALLLCLPFATREGVHISFLDAIFTATSATCVTGLVVADTYLTFTLFGQAVILSLIQIGGLGFVAILTSVVMVTGKRIGLRERTYLMESVSALQLGGVVKLLRWMLTFTFAVEGIGALLLMIRFIPQFGIGRGIWYGIFHSVSAFCNAGFDLMGFQAPYNSLVEYRTDPLVTLVIMALIILGGVGFVVWRDVLEHRRHFRKYSLHAKVVLTGTAILLVGGTIGFLIVERNHTLAGMDMGERILAASFESVTPRTAGFNTTDLNDLSEAGVILTTLLMMVGAAPGSTGGGMKITTMAVIIMGVASSIRQREEINIFRRRLGNDQIRRAFVSGSLYVMMALGGLLVILGLQNLPIRDVVLEVFSAIGTVGLSTGVTREMEALSRIVLIILMYSGRVGGLSVLAAVAAKKTPKMKNPEGKIIIG